MLNTPETKYSKRIKARRQSLKRTTKGKIHSEYRALESKEQHKGKVNLEEKTVLKHHLVKLERVPIEFLRQHVPLLQDGFVIVGVLHNGGRFRVPQELPHVALKASYYLCNLCFTPKSEVTTGKVSDTRRKLGGDKTHTILLRPLIIVYVWERLPQRNAVRRKTKLPCISTLYFLAFFPLFGHAVQLMGILVLQPGIEPRPSEVKAWNPNHWTTSKFSL